MIRVFLVDGSPPIVSLLKKILERFPDITVVGTAENGRQALELIPQLKPDVICSEAYLPGMEGLALIQQLMDICPTPILIVSSPARDRHQELITRFFEAGVIDVLAKPTLATGFEEPQFARELARKIKVLAGVSVFRRKAQTPPSPVLPLAVAEPYLKILVIGASTGGPQAFEAVLSKLPANYPFPVICVQHISKGFLDSFILWLTDKVKLPVTVAKAGEKPELGRIYFAPDDANLELDAQGRFHLSLTPDSLYYPSVDVTLHSLARYYRSKAIAVLLTGMGDDGASGLKAIADAGGLTIAQDEASSVVFGMPKAAIETGAAQKILNIGQIGDMLCHQLNPRSEKYLKTEPWA